MNIAATILPIQTRYKGYRFRSRLEARWAVFFDHIGLPWEYEKEGFDIDGTRYLPDFYFPTLKTYAEVKPTTLTEKEYSLIGSLNGLILDGLPEYRFYFQAGACCGVCDVPFSPAPDTKEAYSCYLAGHLFGVGVNLFWSKYKHRLWYSFGEDIDCYGDLDYSLAVAAARSARFEHGERG